MNARRAFLLLAAAVLSTCASVPPPERPVAFEQSTLLAPGINIGNTLNAPSEGAWGYVLAETIFADIREAGFRAATAGIRRRSSPSS